MSRWPRFWTLRSGARAQRAAKAFSEFAEFDHVPARSVTQPDDVEYDIRKVVRALVELRVVGEEMLARGVLPPDHVGQAYVEVHRRRDPFGEVLVLVLPRERQIVAKLHEGDEALHAALFRVPGLVRSEVLHALEHQLGILL